MINNIVDLLNTPGAKALSNIYSIVFYIGFLVHVYHADKKINGI
jgi:hypothetical protein